jgi:chorismate synthase
MYNTLGNKITLSTFGESHGVAIGGVLDGYPSNVVINLDYVQAQLNKRKPGQSSISTPRKEDDEVEFLSGIFEGKSTGAPIGFIIRNNNQHSADYDALKSVCRPSHADYTYTQKYKHRDHRGGGRSSNRESANWVVAGALCQLLLDAHNIKIQAFVSAIGTVQYQNEFWYNAIITEQSIESTPVRCPDASTCTTMINLINECKAQGNTVGGIINCTIKNVPVGLGNPVFMKLQAQLAHAMLSINATKGFEYGSGFNSAEMLGTTHNDAFMVNDNKVSTVTNNSGGIQGGISNGETIYFRVAFKPVASIASMQHTVTTNNEEVELNIKGRHDPCVVPRAVPIVEALAAIVIANNL